MKKFVAIITLLSVTVVGSAIFSSPKEVEAVKSTKNVSFSTTKYLPNGYAVQLVGVGVQQNAMLYVYSSVNAGTTVIKTAPTNSNYKSTKIIHQTRSYGLMGMNGFGRVVNFDLDNTCTTPSCTVQKWKTEYAASLFTETNLMAEITFDDGIYTVIADKVEKYQREF